jgi:putative transposase
VAGRHECSPERRTGATGTATGRSTRGLGALQPRVPKLRQGSYFPPAVVQGWTAAPSNGIGGGSTRRVDELARRWACPGSARAPSPSCARTSTSGSAPLRTPAARRVAVPVARRDLLKVREGGRIVSVAAINRDGCGRRGPARARRPGPRPLRDGAVLIDLPQGLAPRPQGRHAGDLGRP